MTGGKANPKLPLPHRVLAEPRREPGVGVVLGQRCCARRTRFAGPLRADVGERRKLLQRQPGSDRLRRDERAVPGLGVAGDPDRRPVLRRPAVGADVQPGGRRHPGGRSQHPALHRAAGSGGGPGRQHPRRSGHPRRGQRPEHRSRVPQLLCRGAGSALHVHLRAHRPRVRPICHQPRHAVEHGRVRRDQQGLRTHHRNAVRRQAIDQLGDVGLHRRR